MNNLQHTLDTLTFLDLIHGENAKIFFNVAGITWKNSLQTFQQAESKLHWRNKAGDDICFIVNSGGTTKDSIQRVNAFWIDWDCGRDDVGHYHSDSHVLQKKIEFRQRILDVFAPLPSIVVETRNGFHVYWLAQDDVTIPEFEDVQARLCAHFGSDPKVNHSSALMRVPGFDWVKPTSGIPRFPIVATLLSRARFTARELLGVIPLGPISNDHTSNPLPIRGHNKCSGIHKHCTYCGPRSPTSNKPIVVHSESEATEYFKKQDLGVFLGIPVNRAQLPQKVLCPFHPDQTPSATIHLEPNQNHWLFKCHSTRCGVNGTIIDVAAHYFGTTAPVAYQKLLDHFNVVIDTGWKKGQIESLEKNIQTISDPKLKPTYPALHRWIDRVRADLIDKLELAKKHVVSERNQIDGRSVFSASLREMNRRRSKTGAKTPGFGKQPARVDRYCALGLLTKLADDEIPKHLIIEAQLRRKRSGCANRVSFFMVPEYTPEVLAEANRRAQMLIDAGTTAIGISRTLILDVLGEKIAGEVYPQVHDPRKTDPFAQHVDAAIKAMISERGYATSLAVLDVLRNDAEYASITHRRIQKCLPGTLKRCGLKKTVCTAALKEKYGIDSRGYPHVIVPAK